MPTRFATERSSPRIPVQMATRVHCYGEYFIGTVINLSVGGAFMRAIRQLPLRTRADLSILLGDGQAGGPLVVAGVIVHLADNGMGIKFDTLSPANLARLLAIMKNGGADLRRKGIVLPG